MQTNLLMGFSTLDNYLKGICARAIMIDKPDYNGNWHKRYFPDMPECEAASIWDADSIDFDDYRVYYTYDLCINGGHFTLYKFPLMDKDVITKAKAILRHQRDVVSVRTITIKSLQIQSPIANKTILNRTH